MLHSSPAQRHHSFGHDVAGSTEKAMASSPRPADPRDDADLARRRFLEQLAVASSTAADLWPGSAKAAMELWEEGDPLCSVHYDQLPKPDGYDLDLGYLESFIGLSVMLTGIPKFDRHLANQYRDRYATHPQLSKNLDLLIRASRGLPANPSEDDIKKN